MREKFTDSYVENAASTLMRTRGVKYDEARRFVKAVAKRRFSDRSVEYQYVPSYGNMEIKNSSLFDLCEKNRERVMSPSGSLYRQESESESVLGKMMEYQMEQRKLCKKKMFEAKQKGDDNEEQKWHLRQASIKIIMNAVTGGHALPVNPFYDKGIYNSTTAFGRTTIAVAYTTTEHLLSAKFAWYEEEDILAHFSNIFLDYPGEAVIRATINKYKLRMPSQDDLLNFILSIINCYHPRGYDIPNVRQTVQNMNNGEIAYCYYYCNLKHLFQDNEEVGRYWMDQCINLENIKTDASADISDIDEDILNIVTPIISHRLSTPNVFDVINEQGTEAVWVATVVNHVKQQMDSLRELIDVFVCRDIGIPNLNRVKHMLRQSVIISDTDSSIYTTKDWVVWYQGSHQVNPKAYGVCMFLTYWLSYVHAHFLRVFSRDVGAVKKKEGVMQMKNEFLYPSLILFDAKKTYAGIVSIQEGVMNPEPKPDIKGVQLRGSSVAIESQNFVKEFVVEDILKKSTEGELDPEILLKRLVSFENYIRGSMEAGEIIYPKIDSLDTLENYKKPVETSQVFAWYAWQDIFAPEYGEIHPPGKYPVIPITKLSMEDLSWLKQNYPEVGRRWEKFQQRYSKAITFLMIQPLCNKVPEEIRRFMNIREIIHHNVRSAYLILEQLNLGLGFKRSNYKLLYSDLY